MPVQTDTIRAPRRLAALMRVAISPLSSARQSPGSPPAAINVSEARHFAGLTVSNRQICHKADAGGCLERTALRSRDHEFVGLPAQFIIDAGKHLQGPGDVQHLAVWKCQH